MTIEQLLITPDLTSSEAIRLLSFNQLKRTKNWKGVRYHSFEKWFNTNYFLMEQKK